MAQDIEELEFLEEENEVLRQIRIYNVRFSAFEQTENKFRLCFRLSSAMTRDLIAVLDPALGPPTRMSALPNGTKVSINIEFDFYRENYLTKENKTVVYEIESSIMLKHNKI